MADNEFSSRAAAVAASAVEEQLIQATRDYEDASRQGDELAAGDALKRYAEAKRTHEVIAGAGQQKQNSGQLSNAQRNFLSRRAYAEGGEISPVRQKDYVTAHNRAVSAGLQVDSPEYFRAIEYHVDHMGDGRQPPLSESEAARLCGIDQETYAANAAKLAALKRSGNYQD
jgi:hypothetical protein